MASPPAPRPPPPAPRLLRKLAVPLAFLAWAALLWLWYYGGERHAAAWAALGLWGAKLPAFAAALLAGAALLWLLERRGAGGRGGSLSAFAVLAAAAGAALFVPGLRGRVLVLLLVPGMVAAAVGLGATLLRLLGVRTRGLAEELAWSGALGLGTLSFVFVLLGLAGLFRPWAFAAVLALALAAGLGSRRLTAIGVRLGRGSGRFWRRAGVLGGALALFTAVLLVWRGAHCFAGPHLGEADYDALEYHLAAPLEWLRSGHVAFLARNAYADMPAGVEMLYAAGLALTGDFQAGYYCARLLGLAAATLATLAVYAAGRRLGGRRAALLAAAIFFSGAWLSDLLAAPFVEPFLLLYATVAWAAFARATAFQPPRHQDTKTNCLGACGLDLRLLAVTGLAAGAAAATKYPAAVLVAAPLGAAAFLAGLARCFTNRRSPITDHPLRRAIAGLATIGLLSLALAAPWYLKNWLADGNPVYPLAGSVFPSRHWDALKDARFRKAHAPGRSAAEALEQVLTGRPLPMAKGGGPNVESSQAWQNLFTTPLLLLFLPLVPLALWRRRRGPRGAALWMAALAAVFIAGWALCTHQIERFLWPAYGAVAALGAAGAAASGGALGRRAAAGTVLAWVLFAAPMPFLWTRWLADQPTARKLAGLEGPVQLPRVMAAADHLPPGSRVLLVGEARAALFRVPVLCATVFDTNPLDEALEQSATAAEVAAGLRALGVTHVYYDWAELGRLRDPRRSPGYSVALPDGSLRPPCFALAPEKAGLLDEFERDWLEPVMAQGAAGQSPLTGRRLLGRQELWKLKGPGAAKGGDGPPAPTAVP